MDTYRPRMVHEKGSPLQKPAQALSVKQIQDTTLRRQASLGGKNIMNLPSHGDQAQQPRRDSEQVSPHGSVHPRPETVQQAISQAEPLIPQNQLLHLQHARRMSTVDSLKAMNASRKSSIAEIRQSLTHWQKDLNEKPESPKQANNALTGREKSQIKHQNYQAELFRLKRMVKREVTAICIGEIIGNAMTKYYQGKGDAELIKELAQVTQVAQNFDLKELMARAELWRALFYDAMDEWASVAAILLEILIIIRDEGDEMDRYQLLKLLPAYGQEVFYLLVRKGNLPTSLHSPTTQSAFAAWYKQLMGQLKGKIDKIQWPDPSLAREAARQPKRPFDFAKGGVDPMDFNDRAQVQDAANDVMAAVGDATLLQENMHLRDEIQADKQQIQNLNNKIQLYEAALMQYNISLSPQPQKRPVGTRTPPPAVRSRMASLQISPGAITLFNEKLRRGTYMRPRPTNWQGKTTQQWIQDLSDGPGETEHIPFTQRPSLASEVTDDSPPAPPFGRNIFDPVSLNEQQLHDERLGEEQYDQEDHDEAGYVPDRKCSESTIRSSHPSARVSPLRFGLARDGPHLQSGLNKVVGVEIQASSSVKTAESDPAVIMETQPVGFTHVKAKPATYPTCPNINTIMHSPSSSSSAGRPSDVSLEAAARKDEQDNRAPEGPRLQPCKNSVPSPTTISPLNMDPVSEIPLTDNPSLEHLRATFPQLEEHQKQQRGSVTVLASPNTTSYEPERGRSYARAGLTAPTLPTSPTSPRSNEPNVILEQPKPVNDEVGESDEIVEAQEEGIDSVKPPSPSAKSPSKKLSSEYSGISVGPSDPTIGVSGDLMGDSKRLTEHSQTPKKIGLASLHDLKAELQGIDQNEIVPTVPEKSVEEPGTAQSTEIKLSSPNTDRLKSTTLPPLQTSDRSVKKSDSAPNVPSPLRTALSISEAEYVGEAAKVEADEQPKAHPDVQQLSALVDAKQEDGQEAGGYRDDISYNRNFVSVGNPRVEAEDLMDTPINSASFSTNEKEYVDDHGPSNYGSRSRRSSKSIAYTTDSSSPSRSSMKEPPIDPKSAGPELSAEQVSKSLDETREKSSLKQSDFAQTPELDKVVKTRSSQDSPPFNKETAAESTNQSNHESLRAAESDQNSWKAGDDDAIADEILQFEDLVTPIPEDWVRENELPKASRSWDSELVRETDDESDMERYYKR